MTTDNTSVNEEEGEHYSRDERVISILHPSYNAGSGSNFARKVKPTGPVEPSILLDDTTNNLVDNIGNVLTF